MSSVAAREGVFQNDMNELFITDQLTNKDLANHAYTIRDKVSENELVMSNIYVNSYWRMTMDKRYEIIIYWSSEDNSYLAEGSGTARVYGRREDLSLGSKQPGANYRGLDRNRDETW